MNRVLIALALLSTTVFAGNPHHYYPNTFIKIVKDKGLSDIKEDLFQILNQNHTRIRGERDILGCKPSLGKCYNQLSLGYKGARKVLFGTLHLQEDNKGYYVKDVYCNKVIRSNKSRIGPGRIPSHNVINCEHTWPQSKFSRSFPKGLQKSDLHHLYPTDSHANSVRGNYNFDEVNGTVVSDDCTASYTEGHGGNFEPPREHKGNVARALFYFSVRYQLPIHHSLEETLRKWHEVDPVDNEEIERNQMIYVVQKNRNPFIDMPELVDPVSNF